MARIGNREYIDCPECPRCKPEDALRNGFRWGICKMSGNIVYLEPWEEKRINGKGYIHHDVDSCALFEIKSNY